jgi:IS5 family transposase
MPEVESLRVREDITKVRLARDHLTASGAEKEMENPKKAIPQRKTGEQLKTETESIGHTFRSRIAGYRRSLSTTLETLTVLTLVDLFFFAASVKSCFSGDGKSVNRRRRR